jgi:hypothetical protein
MAEIVDSGMIQIREMAGEKIGGTTDVVNSHDKQSHYTNNSPYSIVIGDSDAILVSSVASCLSHCP